MGEGMKDQADKQTQPLALEQPKRGRGRPATGAAMTPAEKQKAYRERQKASQLEIQERAKAGKLTVLEATRKALDENCKELEKQYRVSKEATARAERAEADFVTLRKKLDKALATIQELKKGNVTENTRIGKSGRDLINSVFEVAEATEGSYWRIQRKSKVNGEWKTLQGSYWNQAKAEDALIDMPQQKGSWWRVIEVKSDVED